MPSIFDRFTNWVGETASDVFDPDWRYRACRKERPKKWYEQGPGNVTATNVGTDDPFTPVAQAIGWLPPSEGPPTPELYGGGGGDGDDPTKPEDVSGGGGASTALPSSAFEPRLPFNIGTSGGLDFRKSPLVGQRSAAFLRMLEALRMQRMKGGF